MNINEKLLAFIKKTPCLDYPTYKRYTLFVLGINSTTPDMSRRENDKKAKRLIDKKLEELKNCQNENNRVNKMFDENEPKQTKKSKRKIKKDDDSITEEE